MSCFQCIWIRSLLEFVKITEDRSCHHQSIITGVIEKEIAPFSSHLVEEMHSLLFSRLLFIYRCHLASSPWREYPESCMPSRHFYWNRVIWNEGKSIFISMTDWWIRVQIILLKGLLQIIVEWIKLFIRVGSHWTWWQFIMHRNFKPKFLNFKTKYPESPGAQWVFSSN